MKLTRMMFLVLVSVFILQASAAVVGGPEAGDGEMVIMGQGSDSSEVLRDNGTDWSIGTTVKERISNISDERIEDISYNSSNNQLRFTGYIQAPTPCHTISQETIIRDNGSYTLNIDTVNDNTDVEGNGTIQSCVQQVVMIKYETSFKSDKDYTLEVLHNRESIESINSKEYRSDEKKNFLERIMNSINSMMKNLF